ncbi:DUF2490 domain-containing protein [Emticicia sp. BO119]|uniref:DUF2490 domain-containing protein n=1 Tax=Emticicia sp. BO119 TaxID=2757768 RepID=UPI0015F0C0DA|nr:DUF2490 domain-containing protein [Emticicia sp. BO119]MBA4853286.1 DUF2490 domain-containing protein [Emticicia sp. BO119]
MKKLPIRVHIQNPFINCEFLLFLSLKNYFFLITLLLPLFGFSQERSTNLWAGINASKSITKKISLEADIQWRINNNLTTSNAYIAELGAGYKFNKHWEIMTFYRFITRRKYDKGEEIHIFKPYHRFYANLIYDHKIAFLKFAYRLRYQNQFKDDNGTLENDKSYLRNRAELSYPNKTKFTPAISADLFYRMGEEFDEIRYKSEVSYKINKKNTFTIGGFISQEFSDKDLDDFTFQLTYKLKL